MDLKSLALMAFLALTSVSSNDALQGDWRGSSICQQKNTACKDEKVVYHVSAPDASGKVTIDADKIVAGAPVDMGKIVLTWVKDKKILDGTDGPRAWRFGLEGRAMHGTLTVSGTPIRKIELTKD